MGTNTIRAGENPKAKSVARGYIAHLEDLEMRLAEDQIQYLGEPPFGDGVSTEHLLKNRSALLASIQSAKKYFSDLTR